MKKKVLIASFFAMLMLIVPFTAIPASSNLISSEESVSNDLYQEGAIPDLEGQLYLQSIVVHKLIPLTEEEINHLLDVIDDIEDEPTRLLAHKIVDRFITEDGELDTLGLQNVLNEYGTNGILTGIIQWIIQWIISKIQEEITTQITGIISQWLLESLPSKQLGWLTHPNGPITYVIEAKALLDEIKAILGKWVGALQYIAHFPEVVVAFLSNIRVITFVLFCRELEKLLVIIEDLKENFPAELEIVKEDVLELCDKTIDFYNFMFPENEEDIPYNKSIIVKGKIVGVDPSNVEIWCDKQNCTPDSDGFFEMEFITTDEEVESYLWHNVKIAIYNDGDSSEISEMAFSMGTINKTFNFSGRPIKPSGPTENVSRFTTQLYKSYAIDPHGSRLEYQWSWDGKTGQWSSESHSSGSEAYGLTFWTPYGECEVKVRSRNENNEVSDWSEPLIVTVIKRFQGYVSSPLLQCIMALNTSPTSQATYYTSQPTSQTSSSSQSTTQQSPGNT